MTLPTPDTFNMAYIEAYKHIRGEIQYEYGSMANRMNWLFTAQAFLFTAYAIAIKSPEVSAEALTTSLYWPHLPIVGIVISLVIYLSCLGALYRIEAYREQQIEVSQNQLVGWPAVQPPSKMSLFLGLVPPFVSPPLFGFVWSCILFPFSLVWVWMAIAVTLFVVVAWPGIIFYGIAQRRELQ